MSCSINDGRYAWFLNAVSAVTRFFTDLDVSASMRYELSSPVTLTGDFEIEIDFATTSASTIIMIGDSTSTVSWIALISGIIRAKIGGTSIDSVLTFNDGKLHTARVVRVGSAITVYVDGVSVASGTDSDPATFNQIGTYINGIYFDGILANLKITDGTTLVADMPLDEDFATTTTANNLANPSNNATAININESELFTFTDDGWLGVELVTNGDFATDSDWTKGVGWTIDTGAGTANGDGTGSNTALVNVDTNLVITGREYITMFDITSYTSGRVNIRIKGDGSGGQGTSRTAAGAYSEVLTAGGNSQDIRFQSSSNPEEFNGSIDNVSVKRLLEVAP